MLTEDQIKEAESRIHDLMEACYLRGRDSDQRGYVMHVAECRTSLETYLRSLSATPAATAPADDIDALPWAGMDGATAFQAIERHADDWAHTGRLMDAWLAANRAGYVIPAGSMGAKKLAQLAALSEMHPIGVVVRRDGNGSVIAITEDGRVTWDASLAGPADPTAPGGMTLDKGEVEFLAARMRRLCAKFGYQLDANDSDEFMVGAAGSIIGAILTGIELKERKEKAPEKKEIGNG